MTLGTKIQQIRTACGLSQEEFGEKLGVTRQTVSKWELDQTMPELEKIVRISRLFGVTTDAILIEGVSTFDEPIDGMDCEIRRGKSFEIVETEQFAYYISCEEQRMTATLYKGYERKKFLVGIVTHDLETRETLYAYRTEDGKVYATCDALAEKMGEAYDSSVKHDTYRTEIFAIDHSGTGMPKVSEVGLAKAFALWRGGVRYRANDNECFFTLCTAESEYVFSVMRGRTNIYCGGSYNSTFDLGLYCGMQYFRIRHLDDCDEPWCRSACDFSIPKPKLKIPTDKITLGACAETEQGILMCVKRYSDDEIVIQNCGDDEIFYHRNEKYTERFVL